MAYEAEGDGVEDGRGIGGEHVQGGTAKGWRGLPTFVMLTLYQRA